jgi:hypothetical protein
MSRKFTAKISKETLAGIIAEAWSHKEDLWDVSHDYNGHHILIDELKKDVIKALEEHFDGGRELTPQIDKDLSKVNFDMENCYCDQDPGISGGSSFRKIQGFHTLPNGLSFLGVCAGGDWEHALLYILYWDGTKLRGYIPTDGNTWNTKTKMAYGNGAESIKEPRDYRDVKACAKYEKRVLEVDDSEIRERFGKKYDFNSVRPDLDKIQADIMDHIRFAKGRSVKPKGLADIKESSGLEARRQKPRLGPAYTITFRV